MEQFSDIIRSFLEAHPEQGTAVLIAAMAFGMAVAVVWLVLRTARR